MIQIKILSKEGIVLHFVSAFSFLVVHKITMILIIIATYTQLNSLFKVIINAMEKNKVGLDG